MGNNNNGLNGRSESEDLDECKTSFGLYLKEQREKSGMTQSEVAAKLGYGSPQFISNIERGVSNVPMKSLRILIGLYGLSPETVIEQILMQKKQWLQEQLGILTNSSILNSVQNTTNTFSKSSGIDGT